MIRIARPYRTVRSGGFSPVNSSIKAQSRLPPIAVHNWRCAFLSFFLASIPMTIGTQGNERTQHSLVPHQGKRTQTSHKQKKEHKTTELLLSKVLLPLSHFFAHQIDRKALIQHS